MHVVKIHGILLPTLDNIAVVRKKGRPYPVNLVFALNCIAEDDECLDGSKAKHQFPRNTDLLCMKDNESQLKKYFVKVLIRTSYRKRC